MDPFHMYASRVLSEHYRMMWLLVDVHVVWCSGRWAKLEFSDFHCYWPTLSPATITTSKVAHINVMRFSTIHTHSTLSVSILGWLFVSMCDEITQCAALWFTSTWNNLTHRPGKYHTCHIMIVYVRSEGFDWCDGRLDPLSIGCMRVESVLSIGCRCVIAKKLAEPSTAATLWYHHEHRSSSHHCRAH